MASIFATSRDAASPHHGFLWVSLRCDPRLAPTAAPLFANRNVAAARVLEAVYQEIVRLPGFPDVIT